ncbi:TPA: hypothetical protein RQK43_004494 [Vibrio vulnificus]|nr:hypothetical protein [Vibrio vulnificus]HDY7878591.1 hypothetical protein [Vibrio vulnificus]
MEKMYLISHGGANRDQVAHIKGILMVLSTDILECVNEQFFLMFYPKGLDNLKQELLTRERIYEGIEIRNCSKNEFEQDEIIAFFEKIENAQQMALDALNGIFHKDL